jgi:NAD(P)-dependent dehydrogenase (short-subunit alcohol dehydrogenase family)
VSQRGWALVTGSGRRIGHELALAAARAGYDIIIHHRTAVADAERTAGEVAALGRRARLVSADLMDVGHLGALMAAEAPVTLLINNAALFEDDRIDSLTPASFEAHMGVNLRAPILLAQDFARRLPADRQGLIVNIADQRVWRPTPRFFSYAISKAALWAATEMLAQGLAPRIRVNAIGPGPTLRSIHQSPQDFADEAGATLLGHGPRPEEIGQALAYLIDAPSVTGQMIAVDGGQHLAWLTPDIVGP